MLFINSTPIHYKLLNSPSFVILDGKNNFLCLVFDSQISIYDANLFVELANYNFDIEFSEFYGAFTRGVIKNNFLYLHTYKGYIHTFSIKTSNNKTPVFISKSHPNTETITNCEIVYEITIVVEESVCFSYAESYFLSCKFNGYVDLYSLHDFNLISTFDPNALLKDKSGRTHVSNIKYSEYFDGHFFTLSDGRCGVFIFYEHPKDAYFPQIFFVPNITKACGIEANAKYKLVAVCSLEGLISLFSIDTSTNNVDDIASTEENNGPSFGFAFKPLFVFPTEFCRSSHIFPSPQIRNAYTIQYNNAENVLFVWHNESGRIKAFSIFGFYLFTLPTIREFANDTPILSSQDTNLPGGSLSDNNSLVAKDYCIDRNDFSVWVIPAQKRPYQNLPLNDENSIVNQTISATTNVASVKMILKYNFVKFDDSQCSSSTPYHASHACVKMYPILFGPDSLYVAAPSLETQLHRMGERIKIVLQQNRNKSQKFNHHNIEVNSGKEECSKIREPTEEWNRESLVQEMFELLPLHSMRNFMEIQVPSMYLTNNLPIRLAVMDRSGQGIAVAGTRGFTHYNTLTRRWRMFGNETQENQFSVQGGLVWWKAYIIFSCLNHDTQQYEVRAYPQGSKLDNVNLAFKYSVNDLCPMAQINSWENDNSNINVNNKNQFGRNSIPPKGEAQKIHLIDVHKEYFAAFFGSLHLAIYKIEFINNVLNLVNINIIDVSALLTDPNNMIAFSLTYFTIESNLFKKRKNIEEEGLSAELGNTKKDKNDEHNMKKSYPCPNVILNICGDLICLQRHKKRTTSHSIDYAPKTGEGDAAQPQKRNSIFSFFSGSNLASDNMLKDMDRKSDNNQIQKHHINTTYSYAMSLIANAVENYWVHELPFSYTLREQSNLTTKDQNHFTDTKTAKNRSLPPYLLDTLWLFRGHDGIKVWIPLNNPTGYLNGTLSRGDLFSKRVMCSINSQANNVYPLLCRASLALIEGVVLESQPEYLLDHLPKNTFDSAKYCMHRVYVPILADILKELIEKNLTFQALDIARSYENHCRKTLTGSSAISTINNIEFGQILSNYLFSLSQALEKLLHEVLEADPTKITQIASLKTPSKSNKSLTTHAKTVGGKEKKKLSRTSTDFNTSNSSNASITLSPRALDPEPLLPRVLAFINEFPFPTYVSVLVNCARKSEIALWPKLFNVTNDEETEDNNGPIDNDEFYKDTPLSLFKKCIDLNLLTTATSLLIILQNLENFKDSFKHAITLWYTVLGQGKWDLAKEIMRYLQLIENETENNMDLFIPKKPLISLERLLSRECPLCDNAVRSKEVVNDKNKMTAILDAYALNLLSMQDWVALFELSANMNFYLVPFLSVYRFDQSMVQDYVKAFCKLHEMFDWPFGYYVNIKYKDDANPYNNTSVAGLTPYIAETLQSSSPYKPTSLPLSPESAITTPNTPDISLAKLVEPLDIQGPINPRDSIADGLDPLTNYINPLEVASQNASNSSIEKSSFIRNINHNTERVGNIQMGLGSHTKNFTQTELQLRFMLKVFMESGCIDWALLVAIILGDTHIIVQTITNWLAKMYAQSHKPDCQSRKYVLGIVEGMIKLMEWSEANCPFYEYLICQFLNPMHDLNFDNTFRSRIESFLHPANNKQSQNQPQIEKIVENKKSIAHHSEKELEKVENEAADSTGSQCNIN